MEKQSLSNSTLKSDKGVAGLTILLSVVAMVFIIGFLVMVFAIIGSNLQDQTRSAVTQTTLNEGSTYINSTGYTLAGATALNAGSFVITRALNGSQVISSGNWTISSTGVVRNATPQYWNTVTLNYTYVYDANTTASSNIYNTVNSVSGVTEWFPIIITITVMVALILLTVIIIVAIRSSGILAGGN